jgi:hypothetical protein
VNKTRTWQLLIGMLIAVALSSCHDGGVTIRASHLGGAAPIAFVAQPGDCDRPDIQNLDLNGDKKIKGAQSFCRVPAKTKVRIAVICPDKQQPQAELYKTFAFSDSAYQTASFRFACSSTPEQIALGNKLGEERGWWQPTEGPQEDLYFGDPSNSAK